jgi:hypothetical protein
MRREQVSRTEKTNWGMGHRTRGITLSPRRIFQCLMSFSAAFHPIFLGDSSPPARVWGGRRRMRRAEVWRAAAAAGTGNGGRASE